MSKVWVQGYTKSDGTKVAGYWRKSSGTSRADKVRRAMAEGFVRKNTIRLSTGRKKQKSFVALTADQQSLYGSSQRLLDRFNRKQKRLARSVRF